MSNSKHATLARVMLKKYAFTKNLIFSRADKVYLLTLLRKARDAK
jgi:hypothetical protein